MHFNLTPLTVLLCFIFFYRIPQDDGECAVKTETHGHSSTLWPPVYSTPSPKLTHDPLTSGPLPLIVHLDNYAASTDKQTNTQIRSAKVKHMMLMFQGEPCMFLQEQKSQSVLCGLQHHYITMRNRSTTHTLVDRTWLGVFSLHLD